MNFQFERYRVDKISREKILEDLEDVAKRFNYIEFGKRDYDKFGKISHGTAIREFKTWRGSLDALREYLTKKSINLKLRQKPYNRIYPDKELFSEMERIWVKVGHRPSRYEWNICEPRISYSTYSRRFGTWTNACLKFIENKMGSEITTRKNIEDSEDNKLLAEEKLLINYKPEENRGIPLGLRLKILDRDNFRCKLCGRSPATELGVQLHIDHIIPFSKGGKSILENLQTLCMDCNLGKSNKRGKNY